MPFKHDEHRQDDVLENDQGQISDALKDLQAAVVDLREHCTRPASKFNIELLPDDQIKSAMTTAEIGNIAEAAQMFATQLSIFQHQETLQDQNTDKQAANVMASTTMKVMSKIYPVVRVLLRLAGFAGNMIDYISLTIAVNAVQTTSEFIKDIAGRSDEYIEELEISGDQLA